MLVTGPLDPARPVGDGDGHEQRAKASPQHSTTRYFYLFTKLRKRPTFHTK